MSKPPAKSIPLAQRDALPPAALSFLELFLTLLMSLNCTDSSSPPLRVMQQFSIYSLRWVAIPFFFRPKPGLHLLIHTIPRLELSGAHLLATISSHFINLLKPHFELQFICGRIPLLFRLLSSVPLRVSSLPLKILIFFLRLL